MKTSILISFLIAIFCTSCSSFILERNKYLAPYHAGDLELACHKVNSTLNKALPTGDYRESLDSTWLLLDSATIHFSQGETAQAIEDYKLALEAIDFYNQDLLLESIGKVVLQDELGAYPGEDFEQILARIYLSLSLLHQGDCGNACALLRQAEEVQQKKRSYNQQSLITKNYNLVDNAIGKYLLATLLEKQKDFSNAEILYNQVAALICTDQINDDLLRLQKNRSETKDLASVVILCHNGNVPRKISEITPTSIVSTIALEHFLGEKPNNSPLSSLSGIPTPTFVKCHDSFPCPTYSIIDGDRKLLTPWFHVGNTAFEQLEQKKPVIVARGIARYLLRQQFVHNLAKQNSDLASFYDLAMFIANLNTKADTRSWTTLPETIDLSRHDLCAGNHKLKIQVQSPDGIAQFLEYDFKLNPGDLCVINVFNIHPHVTTVLIPDRFLIPNNKETI